MLPAPPFVLLDDARADRAPARLYADPVEIVTATTLAEVRPALERLRAARGRGLHAAGYLTYEAGAALLPHVPERADMSGPLLWFGLFRDYRTVDAAALLAGVDGGWSGRVRPSLGYADYGAAIDRVAALIRDGDIYQANLSFRAHVPVAGSMAALYAALRAKSLAGYGAYIDTGADQILSLSPELFFRVDGSSLTAKPMKGTAVRGATAAEDAALADALRADPKQRAENLMIVDLMRNDLSRVARAGSVTVPALFTVETYPTIHTLTSTVTATLDDGRDAIDALIALFPCGSITGAPKIRAMQAIAEIEHDARNLYTGSIGRLDADGDALFNVAIRTLTLAKDADTARLGLGSGVVADSRALEEWDECLAKGAFVTGGNRAFDLIETMAFDPEAGILLLERHLARMKISAERFGYPFDRHETRNELQAATFKLRQPARIRLLLSRSGAVSIGIAPRPAAADAPVRVALRPLPVERDDFRLCYKTSDRHFYDKARVPGAFETVFVDGDGYLTEGSFTSLFVKRDDGMLVTPPLSRGLLPGVLRAELVESGQAVEGEVRAEDLANGFFVGNALRGLIPAVAVAN